MADKPTIQELFGDEEDEDEFAEPPPKRRALAGEVGEEQDEEVVPADDEEPTAAELANEQEAPPEPAQLDEGQDTVETAEDRAFIDDADVAPEERYGSDVEGDAQALQDEEAEEVVEDELDAIFAKGKRKKAVRSQGDLRLSVDILLAKIESAAELDNQAHENFKPAIHKLKMLPEVEEMVGNRAMHPSFMDAGGIGVLRTWLEPFKRDHSLPNAKIRNVVLRLLRQLPIDMSDPRTRNTIRDSGIGRNVMFLFKLPEETAPNRRLAKALVETWSRPIFFDPDSDHRQEARARQQQIEEARRARRAEERAQEPARAQAGEEDEELGAAQQQAIRPGDRGFRWRASIPQAARMDYTRRPESQVSLEGSTGRKARSGKVSKHLEKLTRQSKAGPSKGSRVSIQGRGLAL